jgi:hypothetical protein
MTSSRALLCFLLVSACNLKNPGVDPPAGVLSFPAAMSFRDPSAASHDLLYVANSNFNLRYNAGSVQVYDLAKIERAIDGDECRSGDNERRLFADGGLTDAGDPSAEDGGLPNDGGPVSGGPLTEVPLDPGYEGDDQRDLRGHLCDALSDGKCCFGESDSFLLGGKGKSEILIDSFASALAVAPDGRRLYVPVRSRDRLLYFDIDESGQISCGRGKGRCRRGTVASDEDKDPVAKFEPQATALAVGALDTMVEGNPKGTFLATAHENGAVGFFVDTGSGPVLHSTSFAISGRLTSIEADPHNKSFYLTTAARSSAVSRFGLRNLKDRYVLTPAPALLVDDVAGAFDTRDILRDKDDPARLFVLMRGVVQSVLFLRLDSNDPGGVRFEGQVRVGAGPSRLAQATLDGRRVLFVSCFDERAIYVIEEETRQVRHIIRGLAGPFEMLVDEPRGFLYVADFNVSVVRVVDMQGLFDRRKPLPRIVATLGKIRLSGGLE